MSARATDDDVSQMAAENVRLRELLRHPLSSLELKLVDKNCDWVAFRHSWNAIIKHRMARLETLERERE